MTLFLESKSESKHSESKPSDFLSPRNEDLRENALSNAEENETSQKQHQQQQPEAEPLNLPVSLTTYSEQAKDYARQAKSKNTRRAYASDWDDFARWCQPYAFVPLPAKPETVALYLTALADALTDALTNPAPSAGGLRPSPRSTRPQAMTPRPRPRPSASCGLASAAPKEPSSRAKPRPSLPRSAAWWTPSTTGSSARATGRCS